MLISIEDYLARRRPRAYVASYRVAAAGNAHTRFTGPKATPRSSAQVYVLPVIAPAASLPTPSAVELGTLYAEASLI